MQRFHFEPRGESVLPHALSTSLVAADPRTGRVGTQSISLRFAAARSTYMSLFWCPVEIQLQMARGLLYALILRRRRRSVHHPLLA